jgi:hypothetical protein
MNQPHPMPVMKPKPATFILACALLVLVLAYVKGCAPAPAVGMQMNLWRNTYATEHQNGLTQTRPADGNLESESCAWRNTTHSRSFTFSNSATHPRPSHVAGSARESWAFPLTKPNQK